MQMTTEERAEMRRLKQLEYSRRWKKKNAEHVKEYNKRWKEENAESVRASSRRWKQAHREHVRNWLKEYDRKTGSFLYPTRTWTLDEDLMVLEHSMTDVELSKLLQRSRKSITQRRWRLNTMFKAHMV